LSLSAIFYFKLWLKRRNMAFGEGDELSVVELLEKERKDWQLERLKLIHCIHLQQLELSQRSAAAYDRATDIAKVRPLSCPDDTSITVTL
jgi:hypothetical protein